MQPEERLHEEELELDDEEENSSISCGGAEEVVGNTHLCCHSQLLQTAMCELLTSNLSVNIASNIGFSGVPHFHWRQRVYAPSLYPWILSLRVCSTIILALLPPSLCAKGSEVWMMKPDASTLEMKMMMPWTGVAFSPCASLLV